MSKLSSRSLIIVAALAVGTVANASTVIDFGGLSGFNGDSFSSYSEDGYTVASTQGEWHEAHVFGNGVPALYAGPIGAPYVAEVKITKNDLGDFKLDSFDASSNSAPGTFVQAIGYNNSGFVYYQNWTINSVNTFENLVNSFAGVDMDELYIQLAPGQGSTSMNLDNIKVCDSVPEPASMAALGAGALALARRRRKA